MKTKLAIGSLIALAAFCFYFRNGSVPVSNAGTWKKEFGPSDFKRPDIAALISRYRTTSFSGNDFYLLADEISKQGADALPYAFQLKDERRFYLVYPAHSAPMPLATVRPYYQHAMEIVRRIRDPKAVPILRRHLADVDYRIPVFEAFQASYALMSPAERPALTHDEIQAFLFPKVGLPIRRSEWLRVLAMLPEPARSEVLNEVLQKHVYPVWQATDANWDSSRYTPEERKAVSQFARELAERGRTDAFEPLNTQVWGLNNIVTGCAAHPSRCSGGFDLQIERTLRNDLARSLLILLQKTGRRTLVWNTNDGGGDPGYQNPYVLRLKFLSLDPNVRVSISEYSSKAPFTDAQGTTWDNRQLHLEKGEVFPFEGDILLMTSKQLYLSVTATGQSGDSTVLKDAPSRREKLAQAK